MTESPWKEYDLSSTRRLSLRIGKLKLEAGVESGELKIRTMNLTPHLDVKGPAEGDEPEIGSGWHRWPLENQGHRLSLLPMFPDRPLIARTESPIHLARGNSVRVFVRVPVWVKISLTGERVVEMMKAPVVVLSKTWFGTFMEGELCYWLSTTARRRISSDLFRHHLVICPLQIRNGSDSELLLEEFCLRVAHLSIFADKEALWADETTIVFRGGEQTSSIQTSGRPPAEALEARLLIAAEQPGGETFAARTFRTLKAFSGFGSGG